MNQQQFQHLPANAYSGRPVAAYQQNNMQGDAPVPAVFGEHPRPFGQNRQFGRGGQHPRGAGRGGQHPRGGRGGRQQKFVRQFHETSRARTPPTFLHKRQFVEMAAVAPPAQVAAASTPATPSAMLLAAAEMIRASLRDLPAAQQAELRNMLLPSDARTQPTSAQVDLAPTPTLHHDVERAYNPNKAAPTHSPTPTPASPININLDDDDDILNDDNANDRAYGNSGAPALDDECADTASPNDADAANDDNDNNNLAGGADDAVGENNNNTYNNSNNNNNDDDAANKVDEDGVEIAKIDLWYRRRLLGQNMAARPPLVCIELICHVPVPRIYFTEILDFIRRNAATVVANQCAASVLHFWRNFDRMMSVFARVNLSALAVWTDALRQNPGTEHWDVENVARTRVNFVDLFTDSPNHFDDAIQTMLLKQRLTATLLTSGDSVARRNLCTSIMQAFPWIRLVHSAPGDEIGDGISAKNKMNNIVN